MEFPTREGTSNPGLNYEKEIAALLAIRYAFEESVQDFWIATNVGYVGDTDDVVLCVTPVSGEKLAMLLQLKHENPIGDPKNFKETDFTYRMNVKKRDKKKENFSVEKYFRGYKKFHNHLSNTEEEQPELIQFLRKVHKYAYILYTNKGLEEKLNCLVNVNGNAIFNHLNTFQHNYYYGFKTEDFNFDEDFLQNLYLFPNQINSKGVFNLIKAEIRKLFGSHKFEHVNFDDITKKYLEVIKLWTKGCEFEDETKYIALYKRDIINILSDLLLESYKYNIEKNRFSFYDCPQKNIWNKLMVLKDISIVHGDDLTFKFLKDYIGSEVKENTKKQGKYWKTEIAKYASYALRDDSIPNSQVQMMKICSSTSNGCITMISIYKLLWFYQNLPLLLEIKDNKEYNDILKILKLSNYNLKVIVIITDQGLVCRKINHVNYFASLKDLEPSARAEILNLTVQFQGRIPIQLSQLAKPDMLQHLKCGDIIHIFCNDFNIGNKVEFECITKINRKLSKILISFKALLEIGNEYFLIEAHDKKNCETILIEKLAQFDFKLDDNSKILIVELNDNSQNMEELKIKYDCMHRLLFHKDFLEWKESTGSISYIAKFQITYFNNNSSNIPDDDVSSFVDDIDTNKFQIISACPGMGKSMLLNYIACFATSCVWIISITLRKIAENDETEEKPSEFLRFYIDQLLSEDSSIQNLQFSSMEHSISGGDNPGFDYEKQIAALLALRYAFEESVQDFWIATNVKDVGATDDIVLCITPTEGKDLAILLQLKHENPKGDGKAFVDTNFTYSMGGGKRDMKKERYSIEKYYKGYKKFKDHLQNVEDEEKDFIKHLHKVNNFNYILYTNKGVDKEVTGLKEANENLMLSHLNTSKSVFYGFKSEIFKYEEEFIENFYLFPNQISIEGLFNLIKAEIKQLFGSHKFALVDFYYVTKRYLEIIHQWTKGCDFEKKKKYMTLSKNDFIYILTDILLEAYKYNIEKFKFSHYDCLQKSIWNELMLLKDVSIVYGDELALEFLRDYIGTEVKLNTMKQGLYWKTEVAKSNYNALCQPIPDNQVQLMKLCGNPNNDNITMVSIYKLMWFFKNLPLLLQIKDKEEYNDIVKILKISQYKLKVIVITTDRKLICHKIDQVNYFASLKDLESTETLELKKQILNLTVRFQGRISVPLLELAKTDMLKHLKCVDIIHILCNKFNVGNKVKFGCNHYINRSLSKILIAFKALVEIKNEFFLIEAQDVRECEKMLSEKLATFGFEINKNPQICILESKSIFKKLEKLKRSEDCVHLLVFHEDFLEWKESTESVGNIANYQITDKDNSSNIFYDDVTNFLKSVDYNKFQIISASPGMGKSILLDYITCSATSCVWILSVTLRIKVDDKIKAEPSEFFRNYMKNVLSVDSSIQSLDFSMMVFEDMIKQKKILLLLDGFDEISISHQEEFSNFIEYLQKERYPIMITTRENMKSFLENKFNILSRHLKSFTLDEQKEFLTNFFKSNVTIENEDSNVVLLDFVEQLLNAAKRNLNDRDEEFTGVPLQLELLANNFLIECEQSITTKQVSLNTTFVLLDLYDKFIQNKTKILCDKYGAGEEKWLKSQETNQQLLALEYLFEEHHLRELNIESRLEQYYEEEEYTAQLIQMGGILIARPTQDKINIDFIHFTFAEYLAALWLTTKLKLPKFRKTVARLVKLRFEEPDYYTFLFTVFDRILAKECDIHLDIINMNVVRLEAQFKKNPNVFEKADKINRTGFHVFALYANDYKEEDLIKILDTSRTKNIKVDALDNLNGYNALDYALFNRSWTFANILCELSQYLDMRHYDLNYKPIDNLSLKYKFLYLTIYYNYVCRDLLIGDAYEHTKILDYTRQLSNKIWLYKDGFDFVKNVSTLGEYLKLCGIKDVAKYHYNDIRFAIAFGSKENVELLLAGEKLDINQKDASNEQTLLHYATIYERADVVKMLLSKGADVNITGGSDASMVYFAVSSGCNSILEMFINRNANLNLKNFSSETHLDVAIQRETLTSTKLLLRHNRQIERSFDSVNHAVRQGRLDMARLLIDFNYDFESDTASDSLLHLTAKIGNVELLNLFLDAGLNIDKQNKLEETPLMIAIDNDHVECAKMLISKQADVHAKCKYGDVLSIAISKGSEEVISELINAGCEINRRDGRGNTLLLKAIQDKKVNIVKLVLQLNADVKVQNNSGYTPLHYAAMYGYQDLAIQFLGRGVDINKITEDDYNTALLLALKYGHTEIAKLLISSMAEVNVVNKDKCNSLHYGAMIGDVTLVQDLIAAGEELNLRNADGFTPFQLAIENDNLDIIKLLLSYDVDVTIKTESQNSTLHIAASAGNDEIIRICLENTCLDINEINSLGRTPLLCALRSKKFKTARFLMEIGANIRIKDKFQNSALHYSARLGQDDLVILFLNEGFDVNEKNMHDDSAFSLALLNCHLSTAKLLHSKGSEIDIRTCDRSTTLHLAASCGYNELIMECLDKGYDINTPNFDSNLLIDFAIMKNKFETVKLLIEKGKIPSLLTFNLYYADLQVQSDLDVEEKIKYFKLLLEKFNNINLNDREGNTILHYVCNSDFKNNNEVEINFREKFYLKSVEVLLQLGADFETKNRAHKSAYDLASEKNLEEILQIFDKTKLKKGTIRAVPQYGQMYNRKNF